MCLKQKTKIHSATYISKSPNAIKMHENHNTCPVCLYVHVLAVPQHFSKKHMQVMAFNEHFLTWNYPELQITFRYIQNCPCITVGQAYFISCLNYLHWAHLEHGPAWDPLQLIEWMKKGHYMKILSQARSIDSLSRSLHSGILLIWSSREPENKAYHPKII